LAIIRIERAKQLFTEKPYSSITEISGETGFEDLRHFERIFKRLVGCNPKEYREAAKALPKKSVNC